MTFEDAKRHCEENKGGILAELTTPDITAKILQSRCKLRTENTKENLLNDRNLFLKSESMGTIMTGTNTFPLTVHSTGSGFGKQT